MTRLLASGAALAATVALAACGGGGGGGGDDSASASTAARTTVAVKQVDGIGKVLVDARGKALYSSDVEADGKVRCTGACNSFWKPLTIDAGKPSAAAGVGAVATIRRPDGTKQVTADGKPLYTFSQDAPGKIAGNGFSDDFDGRHFTWNAVVAGGKAAGSSGGDDSAPRGNDYSY